MKTITAENIKVGLMFLFDEHYYTICCSSFLHKESIYDRNLVYNNYFDYRIPNLILDYKWKHETIYIKFLHKNIQLHIRASKFELLNHNLKLCCI